MIQLLGRWKPATVNKRYRGLQAFFRWCLDEDIIARGDPDRELPRSGRPHLGERK